MRRVLGPPRAGGRHRRRAAVPRRDAAAGRRAHLPVARSKNVFAYVFDGRGAFRDASEPRPVATDVVTDGGQLDDDRARYGTDVANRSLLVFDSGDEIRVRAGDEGLRFLLVSGAPIGEPVAWHGPIVMNTQQELSQAFAQLRAGTFLDVR
ncbi:MAG: pirin-like C-terminal cupin domain-containing protein [Vicinamibacterales bacterium]